MVTWNLLSDPRPTPQPRCEKVTVSFSSEEREATSLKVLPVPLRAHRGFPLPRGLRGGLQAAPPQFVMFRARKKRQESPRRSHGGTGEP